MVAVDWFSLTVPVSGAGTPQMVANQILAFARENLQPGSLNYLESIFSDVRGARPVSRVPYRAAIRLDDYGVTMAWGGHSNVCVDFSGAGCAWLEARGEMMTALKHWGHRASRLDLCHDVPDGNVDVFADVAEASRKRSTGRVDSSTGYTRYIGSAKSDKMLRVYRYAEPHPRAHLMRLEVVLRREKAKVAAEAVTRAGVASVTAGELYSYGLEVLLPGLAGEPVVASPASASKDDAGTIIWLSTTVRSSLWKLHDAGVIDISEFIRDVLAVRPEK